MNVLVVYAYQDTHSFGARLHSQVVGFYERRGDTVVISDLYASGFHAVAEKWDFKTSGGPNQDYNLEQSRVAAGGSEGFAEDIQQEIQRLRAADIVIFEFPVWWSAAPAIMKGWFDKVCARGIVSDSSHRYAQGFLRGKQALVVATTNDQESAYGPGGEHGASMIQHLYPLLHGTLFLTGMDVLQPYIAYNALVTGDGEQHQQVDVLAQTLDRYVDQPVYIYKHQ